MVQDTAEWRAWLLRLVVTAVVLAAVVLLVLFRPHGITQASCDMICEGMTQKQVEAIIGLPPGDYQTDCIAVTCCPTPKGDRVEWWTSDEGIVMVGFDQEGKVVSKYFVGLSEKPRWSERLRELLGRLFH